MSEEKLNTLLSSLLDDDTLSASDISNHVIYMKNLKEIKNKYQDKIKQRKDGRQYYVLINRKQISSTTLDGLYKKLYDLEYSKLNSTIRQLFPEFMIWKRDNTSATPKTLREYMNIWNKTLVYSPLIDKPINILTRNDFVNYFRSITKDRQMKRKYFSNIKSVLNGILYYSVELGIIEHNLISDIDCRQFSFKPVNNNNDVITYDERILILKQLQNDDSLSSLAIQFDFYMVLRIAELQALKWSDIENDFLHIQRQRIVSNEMNDDLTFTPKVYENADHIKGYTENGFRYIPLVPKAKEILNKIRTLYPSDEYIFMQNGRQLSTDSFNNKLKKVCKELGIKEYSSHKIRFSSASILYSNGMPLTELQALLGHTTTAMTMHYIRSVTPKEKTTKIMENSLI